MINLHLLFIWLTNFICFQISLSAVAFSRYQKLCTVVKLRKPGSVSNAYNLKNNWGGRMRVSVCGYHI